mmetsp:Transcript_12130/g.22715  ORF Transcript_12130/g.22715 Transcript_12130/m.22715 type:complete len:242 (+) Transcript_12130:82-807(+)
MDIIIIDDSSSEEEDAIHHGEKDNVQYIPITATTAAINFTKQELKDDDNNEWNVVSRRIKTNENKIVVNYAGSLQQTPFITSTSSFMIMLIGIPGSGKSHLANMLVRMYPHKFIRISQDTLKTRIKCELACRDAINSGKVPIIDRCNINPQQRQSFLSIASECNIPVDGILFQYSQQVCTRRCEERPFHETLDKSDARRVVAYMVKDFNPPDIQTDRHMFRSMKQVSSFHQANAIVTQYIS